jgi:hypothetical protein
MIAFGSMSRCPRYLGIIARGEGQRGLGAAGDRPSDTKEPNKHEASRFRADDGGIRLPSNDLSLGG